MVAYMFARTFDWLVLSFIMVIFFKFLFSLKRVEIQMNEKIGSFENILKALRRQFCIERIVLGFYLVNVIYILVMLGVMTSEIIIDLEKSMHPRSYVIQCTSIPSHLN